MEEAGLRAFTLDFLVEVLEGQLFADSFADVQITLYCPKSRKEKYCVFLDHETEAFLINRTVSWDEQSETMEMFDYAPASEFETFRQAEFPDKAAAIILDLVMEENLLPQIYQLIQEEDALS